MKVLVIALSAALLAIASPAGAKEPNLNGYKEAAGGWLVVSLADNGCGTSISLGFQRLDAPGKGEAFAFPGGIRILSKPDDVSESGLKADVVIKKLPAGRYKFDRLGLSGGCYGFQQDFDLSMPFEITEARGLYVGQVRVTEEMGKNMLGLAAFAGWTPELTDQSERDLPIAEKKLPPNTEVDITILERQ